MCVKDRQVFKNRVGDLPLKTLGYDHEHDLVAPAPAVEAVEHAVSQ
jgi:hypothetical protein